MDPALVLDLAAVGPDQLPSAGGKAVNLGWMLRAGLPVPPGFCVTTAAFARFLAGHPDPDGLLGSLDPIAADDVEGIRVVAAKVRAELDRLPLPPEVVAAVVAAWKAVDGPEHPWAVRSSATAEDLPGASFAGQHDTFLQVRGEAAVLDAVRRCFASLFTDRAVAYRIRNGFGHRGVALAVVVQRMVLPDAAGILFTADPRTGDRDTVSIDAGFGLGEALVSGIVDPDLYRVDKATGVAREVRIGDKALAIRPLPGGGTESQPLPDDLRKSRVLTDAQLVELTDLGRRVEAAAGSPQDLEWCYEQGRLYLVQARPITTLYPVPPTDDFHLYFSFGHAQMMSDALPPLVTDTWVHLLPFGRGALSGRIADRAPENRALPVIGSRLYVDVTTALRIPRVRNLLLGALATVYPQIPEVLGPHLQRVGPDLHPRPSLALIRLIGPVVPRVVAALVCLPADRFAKRMNAGMDRVLAAAAFGPTDRPRQARDRIATLFPNVPRIGPPFIAAILSQRLLAALGVDRTRLEPVLRALPGNVTTEMDLELADLADLVRPYPSLAAALRREGLVGAATEPGGAPFVAALDRFLDRYGMRGAGEIDLSRPRWRDQPQMLLNVVLGAASDGEARGSHRQRHAALAREAEAALERIVGAQPWWKRAVVRRLLRVVRAGQGLREHPKSMLVRVFDGVRRIVLAAGDRLAATGALERADDVWFLQWDELVEADEGGTIPLRDRVTERRRAFETDRKRPPPLALTSRGERLEPQARTDLPEGAIGGIGASGGVVEGVARVVRDPAVEVLLAGEILVAPSTDPGWTPLFAHAAGVVTEIGGLMTHGSVVAREMGIPAVVGATGATTRIKTGDRVRVDGDNGWVAVIP